MSRSSVEERGGKRWLLRSGLLQLQSAQKFLEVLFAPLYPRPFAVCFCDVSEWPAETESPAFTLVLKHAAALRWMFSDVSSDLRLGEAYIYDDFDIKGDIFAVFPVADRLGEKARLLRMLHRLLKPEIRRWRMARLRGKRHSIQRDREAIRISLRCAQ